MGFGRLTESLHDFLHFSMMFILVGKLTFHTAPHPLVRRSPNPRRSIEDTRMQVLWQNSAIVIRGERSYSTWRGGPPLNVFVTQDEDYKDEVYN